MLRSIVGLILCASLAHGDVKRVLLCEEQTSHKIQCVAGKVILIKAVFRVQPSTKHCGYQTGDHKEYKAGVTKQVWKDCNMWSDCNVILPPIVFYYEFVEIHYECLQRALSYINEISVCKGSSLEGNQGYIHSPGYPYQNPAGTVQTNCTCSATLNKATPVTVKVYSMFTSGMQTLDIHWDSTKESVPDNLHFHIFKHNAATNFRVSFSTSYAGAKFWLEYKNEEDIVTAIKVTCSDGTTVPTTTTVLPVVTKTTTTPSTTTTTTTTTTATTTTTTTTEAPVASTLPASQSTPPTNVGTKDTSATTISTTSKVGMTNKQSGNKDIIPIVVGVVIGLLVIVAVVVTVILVLKKRRAAANDSVAKDGSGGVELNGGIVNLTSDPESGERTTPITGDNASAPDEDPIEPVYSTEGELWGNAASTPANVGVDGTLYADITVGGAAPATKSSVSKPGLKPKPAARTKSGPKVGESSGVLYADMAFANEGGHAQNSEYEAPPGDVYAVVDKPGKGKKGKAPGVQTDNLYSEVDKSSKKKKDAKPSGDSNVEQTGDVYAEVDKSAKKQTTQRKPEVAKRSIPKGGAQSAPSGDVYAQVQKGRKMKPAPPAGKRGNDYHNMTETSGMVDNDLYCSMDDDNKMSSEGDLGSYDDGALYGSVDGD